MEVDAQTLSVAAPAGALAYHFAKKLYDAYATKVIDKSANALAQVPDLLIHLEYIKSTLIKVEAKLEILTNQKEENARKIILLEEKAKAAHKRLDNLKANHA